MGWASGADLLEGVLRVVEKKIPAEKRKDAVEKLVDLFEGCDADTLFDDPQSPTLKKISEERYGE